MDFLNGDSIKFIIALTAIMANLIGIISIIVIITKKWSRLEYKVDRLEEWNTINYKKLNSVHKCNQRSISALRKVYNILKLDFPLDKGEMNV